MSTHAVPRGERLTELSYGHADFWTRWFSSLTMPAARTSRCWRASAPSRPACWASAWSPLADVSPRGLRW